MWANVGGEVQGPEQDEVAHFIPLRVINSRDWDCKLLSLGYLPASKREISIVSTIRRL